MRKYWSPTVRQLTPYVPGEQPKLSRLIKLNTNELPYPPSPKVAAAILEALGPNASNLRLYPDPDASALKAAIATRHGLSAAQVFVGNGSDEVLAHVFNALLKQDAPILFPDISYSFYPVYCGLYQVKFQAVPLADDFTIRPPDYAAKNGGVLFPNPNAPTGRLLPLAAIETILLANPDRVVVVDEAYIDFSPDGSSAIFLLDRYPQLLIVQTLSKARALAGLRVGFALGHPELIQALDTVKNSFNSYPLDRLAIAGAVAAFDDEAYFQRTRQQVITSRETLSARLTDLGFDVIPSGANFVFARHAGHDAAALARALRERGIIVRHFAQPRIDQHLRITIGTDDECEVLLSAVKEIVARR